MTVHSWATIDTAILRLEPTESAEQRVRAALAAQPDRSIRAVARATGVSHSTASKYARLVRAERTTVHDAGQQVAR